MTAISNSETQNHRIKWMDTLKLFTIFLVLWGHCIQHLLSSDCHSEPLYLFIYSFHMPLFMFISGFFGARIGEKKFSFVLKSKARQLLIPCLTSSVIFALLCNAWDIYSLVNMFWFLKSAFVCALCYYLISKTKKFFWPILLISLALCQTASIYKLNTMFPCFVAGALANKYFGFITKHSKSIFFCSALVFILLYIGWDDSIYSAKIRDLYSTLPKKEFLFKFSYLRFYVISIGLAGSLMFISLFEYLSHLIKPTNEGNLISEAGKYTLGIYILQTFIIEVFLRQFLSLDSSNFFTFNFLIAPLISIIVMGLCLLLIRLIHKNRLTSFLLLGEKRRQG